MFFDACTICRNNSSNRRIDLKEHKFLQNPSHDFHIGFNVRAKCLKRNKASPGCFVTQH